MNRPRRVRQYLIGEEFARGGIATVHLAKHTGDRGFTRIVAVKMLHPRFASSRYYTRALEQEARLAARIRHAHVVQSLDVVAEREDVLLVMEYVEGVSLAMLLAEARQRKQPIPVGVTASIVHDALLGLDAAHEARDERGRALAIVHRDVSPQNILVGADGIAKLTDFGIAKAVLDEAFTASGAVHGKLAYMSPEQRRGLPVGRQADLFAAGVVLAETLTGRMCPSDDDGALAWRREVPSELMPRAVADLFSVATKSASSERYASAAEMAAELERILPSASKTEVRRVVLDLAGDVLEIRAEQVAAIEALKVDDAREAYKGDDSRQSSEPDAASTTFHASDALAHEATQTMTQPILAAVPPPTASRTDAAPTTPARRGWLSPLMVVGGGALLLSSLGLAVAAFARARPLAQREDAAPRASPVSVAQSIEPLDSPAHVVGLARPPPSGLVLSPVEAQPHSKVGPASAEKRRPAPSERRSTNGSPAAPAPSTPTSPPLDPFGTRL